MKQNHDTIKDIAKEDYRFILEKPDASFSPERNYAVIREVIADGEKWEKQMRAARQDEIGERVDILSTYGRKALDGRTNKKFDDFMGREWMKKIYGEKILEKLRIADSIKRLNKANGNTKFEDYFLV